MLKYFIFFFLLVFSALPSYSAGANFGLNWFLNFNDDVLIKYINMALANNNDIEIARKNVLNYRHEKNIQLSNELPEVYMGADYLLLKVPKLAIPDNDIQTNSFALPFLTTWEVDYLGKNYNKIQKSRLDVEDSILDLKSAYLVIATETAGVYFNISCLNEIIQAKERILSLKKENFQRRSNLYKYGIIDKNELDISEEEYINELNELHALFEKKEGFLSAMAYLTGNPPHKINNTEITPFDKISYTGEIPYCLKGDIIINRPDILKIENELKKAKLDVTIAKKEFLPTINIFGIMTFSTFVQNFGWKGALAALSSGAFQTLFDGGKKIFKLKKTKIEYEIAFQNYLKADLNALKELNDALFNLKSGRLIYDNDEKRLKIKKEISERSKTAYKNGIKSYLDCIDDDIEYYAVLSDVYGSKNRYFSNLLTLYKASGGVL